MEILQKMKNSKIFDEISEKDLKALHFCFKTRVFEVKKGEILINNDISINENKKLMPQMNPNMNFSGNNEFSSLMQSNTENQKINSSAKDVKREKFTFKMLPYSSETYLALVVLITNKEVIMIDINVINQTLCALFILHLLLNI